MNILVKGGGDCLNMNLFVLVMASLLASQCQPVSCNKEGKTVSADLKARCDAELGSWIRSVSFKINHRYAYYTVKSSELQREKVAIK